MPQDGSNNYYYPPGTPGVPDTTIESEAYNNFLDDLVVNDLNIARPVHRGGTGATTAAAALTNLSAEKANQIVTNYDTHVWVAGSFSSTPGATGAPTGNFHMGIAYVYDANNITVEARVLATTTPGAVYVRQKQGGVWGSWVEQPGGSADLDARYVNLTGDTMTGSLVISFPGEHPRLYIHADASHAPVIAGMKNTKTRWEIYPGNLDVESGGNTGSNFQITAVDDTGVAPVGAGLTINRSTLRVELAGDPTSALHAATKQYADLKVAKTGDTMTGTLTISAANPVLALNRTAATGNALFGQKSGVARWAIELGDGGAESGSNTGSGFTLLSFTDAGALAHIPISIARADGKVALNGAPTAATHAATKQYVDTSVANPGTLKAGALIDAAGGRGFSFGIASVVDIAVGASQVNYSVAYSSPCPVVSTQVPLVDMYSSTGSISTGSVTLHSMRQATGALADPHTYSFHLTGS